MTARLLTGVWLIAVGLCLHYGWTNGLLAIIAILLMEIALTVGHLRLENAGHYGWVRDKLGPKAGQSQPAQTVFTVLTRGGDC